MTIPCETCISFAICKPTVIRHNNIFLSRLFLECDILKETTLYYCQKNGPKTEFLYTHLDLYKKAFKLFVGDEEGDRYKLNEIIRNSTD